MIARLIVASLALLVASIVAVLTPWVLIVQRVGDVTGDRWHFTGLTLPALLAVVILLYLATSLLTTRRR